MNSDRKYQNMKKLFFSLAVLMMFTLATRAQVFRCEMASVWVGHSGTVCGEVMGSQKDSIGKLSGTVLFMCKPYPNQYLTVVIKDQEEPIFNYSLQDWIGKQMCVTGTIKAFKSQPYIEVRNRHQIVFN